MKPPVIAVLDADDNQELSAEEIAGAPAALKSLDYSLDEILKVTPQLQGPVGRMQRLGGGPLDEG